MIRLQNSIYTIIRQVHLEQYYHLPSLKNTLFNKNITLISKQLI